MWGSCGAHLDVIRPPNGAPKRFGYQNGTGKLPGLEILIFGGQQATESYLQFWCFSDHVYRFFDLFSMQFAGVIS